jgi:hypothetical protein
LLLGRALYFARQRLTAARRFDLLLMRFARFTQVTRLLDFLGEPFFTPFTAAACPQAKSCVETSPRHTVTSRDSWTLPSGVSQVSFHASVLPETVIVSGPADWRAIYSVNGVPGAAA